jgi:hypothetical protein
MSFSGNPRVFIALAKPFCGILGQIQWALAHICAGLGNACARYPPMSGIGLAVHSSSGRLPCPNALCLCACA